MTFPLQITFSNMTPSDAVRDRIEELAGRLGRFHERIMSCRVVVRAPNSVPKKGFRKLAVGSKVRYQAEAGEKGLRATMVKPVGRARTSMRSGAA